jgi:hypothetical protein
VQFPFFFCHISYFLLTHVSLPSHKQTWFRYCTV